MSENHDTIDCGVIEASFLMRRDMYSFFDHVFRREPNNDSFKQLEDMLPIINAYAENFGKEPFRQNKSIVEKYLLQNSHETADILATEFSRIFYSVDRFSAVHPYESVYLSPERIMMQEPRDEVAKFYAENKLVLKKDVKEIEDHLSIEMCFMSHIHAMIACSAGADDAALAVHNATLGVRFLKEHLCKWVGLLYSDMIRLELCPFYVAACGMVVHFLEEDSKFLVEFIELLEADKQ